MQKQEKKSSTESKPEDRGSTTATEIKRETSPPPAVGNRKPRQKRWAPKLKTGCKTCRARRVKCDETKPYCKQCTSRGKWCEGYGMTSPILPTTLSGSSQQTNNSVTLAPILPARGQSSRSMVQQHGRPLPKVTSEPVPPSWNLMEAFRYCTFTTSPQEILARVNEADLLILVYGIMAPEYMENSLGDSQYDSQFLAPPTFIIEHSFLMVVTAHRIRAASQMSGLLPAPDQMPAISHIWERFHHHMIQSLDNVNRQISGPDVAIGVFYRIMDILHVELTLLSPTWRGHIEGCATLIRLYGGIHRVLRLSIGKPSPILAIQLILIIATLANTTSPSNNQMEGFSSWSEHDIRTVYSTTMYSEVPCPTELFLNIMEISRLRGLVATLTPPYSDAIWPAISNVFNKIDSFVPENWTEPYTVPAKPEMTLIARIYKYATTLYAVLSLPPPPITSRTHGPRQAASEASYKRSKLAARDRLFQETVVAMATLKPNLSLCWPLAVLGASLVDGESPERTFVEKSLRTISRTPQVYYGPTMSLVKLMAFWKSGKTGWDECFDEPCSVMA